MATYAPGTFSPQNLAYFAQLGAAAKARKPAPAPRPLGLPGGQEAMLNAQRDTARNTYRTDIATNEYQRGNAADQWIAQLRNLQQGFTKQRTQIPYNYNARGILGSGVWQQGLNEMLQEQLRQKGDVRLAQSQQLGGFDLQRQQIEAQRAQALASIEAQRQALMAQYAPGQVH